MILRGIHGAVSVDEQLIAESARGVVTTEYKALQQRDC